MTRTYLALAAFFLFPPGVAWSGDEGALRPQPFAYHPWLLEEVGPALTAGAPFAPRIDPSRAYLLEISEEEFAGPGKPPIRNLWDRIRQGFAMAPLRGPLVSERERWYIQRKELVTNISHKARRYLFHIAEAVEKRGMPMELALLPFIESGFEPGALSTAQASGLWQFIPGTAQRYQLKLTDHYDARRDIVASTGAALDYLQFLHGMFGDWQLALASYNWGEEAVLRAMQRNRAKGLPTDYESLALPEETRHYLPKLMAIRKIVHSPDLHGIELADIPNTPYFAEVDVREPLDIDAVARLAGLPAAEVRALNPSHNSSRISGKGKPALLLPADRIQSFMKNVADHSRRVKPAKKPDERRGARKAVISSRGAEDKPL